MENIEKENKRLKTLLIIMIFVLLGVGAYHYCVTYVSPVKCKDDNLVVENNVVTSKQNVYTYEKIAGLYFYTENIDIEGEIVSEKYYLLLNEDGTYFYCNSLRVAFRHAGNYIMDGNKIIINELFSISDGISVTPYFKTINMIINENGTITYNAEKNYGNTEAREIVLEKQNDNEKREFIKAYGADKETLLNNSFYTNNYSQNG